MRDALDCLFWVLVSLLISLVISEAVSALPPGDDAPAATPAMRAQLTDVLAYVFPDKKISAEETDALLAVYVKAQQPGLDHEARAEAFSELYRQVGKLMGMTDAMLARVATFGEMAATSVEHGNRMDLALHFAPPGSPPGRIHVVERGHGPVPVLLIGDIGMEAEDIYGGFMARNADRYTMYGITLPAFGPAPAPPRPAVRDFTLRPWLKNAEAEIARFLEEKNLNGVVVIGCSAGGYFAAELVIQYPERFRAAILGDALVAMPLRSPSDPNRPANAQERQWISNLFTPLQFFPMPPLDSADQIRKVLDDPNNSNPMLRNFMAIGARNDELTKQWTVKTLVTNGMQAAFRYGNELRTTDLTDAMKTLTVPTLVLGARHDDNSPSVTNPTLSQWLELKLAAPQIPLTIVPFEDARSYLSVDAPEEFDRAVVDFLAGKPVEGRNSRRAAARPSPSAGVFQTVGTTQIEIHYSRPAVKGREVWGKLVPYNRVWRTGANEATTISFTTDVEIEGRRLPAGTYTFFTIPTEKDWTVILNRIPIQWGAFNYNPAFDALRVTAAPRPAEMQEYFTIRVEPTADDEAQLVFQWEKLAVQVKIKGTK